MSDAESLMWRLEKDPYLSSTFASVTILDRPADIDRFRRRMANAVLAVPRLRQRVVASPANLSPPVWVEDPDFDLDYHLRHIALPAPGTIRQLLDYAELVAADPFDRTRPLWTFVVVDGLDGGRGALVEKLHHTIADGEGSIRLSMQFLDLERDAAEPPPPDPETIEIGEASSGPGPADALKAMVAGGLRLPIGMVRQLRDLIAEPASLPGAGTAAVDSVRGLISQLGETDAARSPLWTRRSLRHRIEVVRAPFRETRDAAKRLGGSLNTAFLTAAADAAGEYHRRLGAPVEALRASMAISTRTSDSGSNAFTLAKFLVPTGSMPIEQRFIRTQQIADEARATSGGTSLDALSALTATLPTSLLTRIARQQGQTVDFATSNVRAASFPVYLAGAKVVENYAVGPLGGVAFNLTLMSYHGSLDMGLHLDAAAVAEPELLRDLLAASFRHLASPPRRQGPGKRRTQS